MARQLTTLPKTAFSGLSYDNIMEDIINLVKDNPNYNTNWDDFLSSDAGRMMIELFAYIADQLATRIDWTINENYLSTATQKRSVMRLLKIIGYNFTLPIASEVEVKISTIGATYPGSYYLTESYDASIGTLSPYTIQTINTFGTITNFELLSHDSITNLYNYKIGVKIESALENHDFYEGTTYVEDFTTYTDNAPTFTLTNSPVIEASPRVYFVLDTGGTPVETELLLVDSFLDPDAQAETDANEDEYAIPYIINVNEDETVTIEFGSTGLLPNSNRRLAVGDVIKVFYRTGGGPSGNISTQSINTTKTLNVELVVGGDTIVQATLLNESEGAGGALGETASHAATYAPLQLRTVNKAVSAEDYDTILNSNSSLLTAKAYGNENVPSTVFTNYGVYLNPFDVWIYALPDAGNWSEYLPSQYNDIEWMSLRLQNYFNSIISFRDGNFNYGDTHNNAAILGKSLFGDTIDWDGGGDSQFKNYIVLEVPDGLKDYYDGNSSIRIKVTPAADSTSQFENLVNVINGELKIGDTPGDSVLMLRGDTHAYYKSLINVESGIDMTTTKWLRLSVDGLSGLVIDLSSQAINTSLVRAHEIAAAINIGLYNAGSYGIVYGDSLGTDGTASVVEPTTAESYIKLTSPALGDSSFITFRNAVPLFGDSDATGVVFGTHVAGDTYSNYGYQRITFVTNSAEANYQKIIYENGSINLDDTIDDFYVHYLTSTGDTVSLGRYYYDTYGGVSPNDPKWRSIARRVYNTVNESGDTVPDMYISNFDIRFTDAVTTSMSLYNITDSWNLIELTRPKVSGVTNIIGGDGDTVIGVDSDNCRLQINIDGLGDTIVDVSGDSGEIGDTYGYPLTTIISNINTQLRAAYGGEGSPYNTFTYAKTGDTYPRRIVIEGPTATNGSYIKFSPQAENAEEELQLIITEDGDSHYHYPTGDYYFNYNVTTNMMELMRANFVQLGNEVPTLSNLPDGDFYIHFIWDRREETTGEDTYQTYLDNSKIISVENIFKQTKFSIFYITGIVYYKSSYSRAVVKDAVESALEEKYSLRDSNSVVQRDYGKSISRSQVLKVMLDVVGVEYVEISYFGTDRADTSTNQENTISCNFDEIIVLHQNGLSLTYLVYEE